MLSTSLRLMFISVRCVIYLNNRIIKYYIKKKDYYTVFSSYILTSSSFEFVSKYLSRREVNYKSRVSSIFLTSILIALTVLTSTSLLSISFYTRSEVCRGAYRKEGRRIRGHRRAYRRVRGCAIKVLYVE